MKEARKHLAYRGIQMRIIFDFSETMHVRREYGEILKVVREKTHQPKILYPVRLSFKSKGETSRWRHRSFLTTLLLTRRTANNCSWTIPLREFWNLGVRLKHRCAPQRPR